MKSLLEIQKLVDFFKAFRTGGLFSFFFFKQESVSQKGILLVLSGGLLTEMNEVFLLYAASCPYSTPSWISVRALQRGQCL